MLTVKGYIADAIKEAHSNDSILSLCAKLDGLNMKWGAAEVTFVLVKDGCEGAVSIWRSPVKKERMPDIFGILQHNFKDKTWEVHT